MIITHNGTTITVEDEDKQYQILGILFKNPQRAATTEPTKRVYRKRKGTKHRWTPEQKGEMLSLRDRGISLASIARQFGTTEKAVSQQLWQARKARRKVNVNVLPETVPAGFAR